MDFLSKWDVLNLRLQNQYLMEQKFAVPLEVVNWLGAVQAQDYQSSLWGIGIRAKEANATVIEDAIESRQILRTWPMRNTIHFVPAKDAAWMLKLLTPRASKRAASVYQKAELDEQVFLKSAKVITKALEGGKRFTRKELYELLEKKNITTTNSRGMHIIGQLAYQGLICFGPRVKKQPTFVLLEDWVPHSVQLEGEEALAVLAKRYFTGHGPAALKDFAWWAGLTLADARKGLQLIRKELVAQKIDNIEYWFSPVSSIPTHPNSTILLLPAFDEFTVAYQDRSLFLNPKYKSNTNHGITRTIVRSGQIVGTWNQTIKKNKLFITPILFEDFDQKLNNEFLLAVEQYGDFLQLSVEIQT